MFSQVFVYKGVCLQGGLFAYRVSLHPGGSAYRGSLHSGGDPASRGLVEQMPPPETRKAGGTHPTGMLSCDFVVISTKDQSRDFESVRKAPIP